MSVYHRNNVKVTGGTGQTMLFAHGFGCDQEMWRFVAPAFEAGHKVVLFDLTGAGKSDLGAYDFDHYAQLDAHAEDILRICDELELRDVVLVGHSVSAITSVLAANARPDLFAKLVLLAPSPCFLEDNGYHGGFKREDLEGLVAFMDENYLGWSAQVAAIAAGQDIDGPASVELTRSFCRTDPAIAQHFGRVTFLSDRRADMQKLTRPALIVQCSDDTLAPTEVGRWLHDNIGPSTLEILEVTGHSPHLTAPAETIDAIRRFIDHAPA